MDRQISHSNRYFLPTNTSLFCIIQLLSKKYECFSLHIPTIKTSQPANQKEKFVLLVVPAHGTHYGVRHWVLLLITGNLCTLIDFSALTRDLDVVVLKISAMYSEGRKNLFVYIVAVWTHSGWVT